MNTDRGGQDHYELKLTIKRHACDEISERTHVLVLEQEFPAGTLPINAVKIIVSSLSQALAECKQSNPEN